MARFFCRPITTGRLEMTGAEAHHLATVRRRRGGDEVELFDGQGGWARATICEIQRQKVVLEVTQVEKFDPPQGPAIIIAANPAKGERFDRLISKCTELGVNRIYPVRYERTVKQAQGGQVVERWNKLAIAAAKQCERLFLPVIAAVEPLQNVLQRLKEEYPQGTILVGERDAEAEPLVEVPMAQEAMTVLIGPEGGFTRGELEELEGQGAIKVRLTDTILRVETAAMAAAAILTARREAARREAARR